MNPSGRVAKRSPYHPDRLLTAGSTGGITEGRLPGVATDVDWPPPRPSRPLPSGGRPAVDRSVCLARACLCLGDERSLAGRAWTLQQRSSVAPKKQVVAAIVLSALVAAVALAIALRHPLVIRYHVWRMELAMRAFYSGTPKEGPPGLVAYDVTKQLPRYEHHRDRLVALGYFFHQSNQFDAVPVPDGGSGYWSAPLPPTTSTPPWTA